MTRTLLRAPAGWPLPSDADGSAQAWPDGRAMLLTLSPLHLVVLSLVVALFAGG
ncbi:hypothetical protein [uncultured Methylobacterium sp.]|jgi:hypothetical protein|uniref:hypothetical protein n=1 Tax=uncultured Methylobacterium sp. TaxID=157278 RepID=UPI0026393AF9|nr:hypothetical protein [uncultured Methylobacterium sp.]